MKGNPKLSLVTNGMSMVRDYLSFKIFKQCEEMTIYQPEHINYCVSRYESEKSLLSFYATLINICNATMRTTKVPTSPFLTYEIFRRLL